MSPQPLHPATASRLLLDVLIRAGLIVLLALFCFDIFRPFLSLVLWSLITALLNEGARAVLLIITEE